MGDNLDIGGGKSAISFSENFNRDPKSSINLTLLPICRFLRDIVRDGSGLGMFEFKKARSEFIASSISLILASKSGICVCGPRGVARNFCLGGPR